MVREELVTFIENAKADKDKELAKLVTPYDEFLLHGQYACANDQVEKALRSFKECVRLRQDSFVAQCALGRIYMVQGQFAKAEKRIRKAAEIDPGNIKNNITLLYLLNKTKSDPVSIESLQYRLTAYVKNCARNLGFTGIINPDIVNLSSVKKLWFRKNSSVDRANFNNNDFVVLDEVLPEDFSELIRLQQIHAVRTGKMGHQPDLKRYGLSDLSLPVIANYQLANLVSQIINQPVIPTYTFAIHYMPGGYISAHTDRPQNEISMSLSLGNLPPDGTSHLFAHHQGEKISIPLKSNSALLYRGARVTHGRDPVPADCTVDQAIFGFRTIHKNHCYCI